MDFLIGLVGKDFTLVASDTSQVRSVIRMKSDLDKMITVSEKNILLLAGPVGDCNNFGDYIQKNLKLNAMRNGFAQSPHASAHYIRKTLAESLRSRERYQVDLLLGGHDEHEGPKLYWIDHLAALAEVPYAAHGYGGFFTLATLDRHYRKDMSLEEAKDVLRKCILEVRTRFIVNMPAFKVRYVDKDGVHEVDDIEDETTTPAVVTAPEQ
eukprot:TRINITY_DN9003_c0_g1_i3.p1 TRINITY_DN9003_c0_g1~~TRINITY_DN9003_c0_g1_i3.p1  ORF type:complete len:210 (+),score=38.52 TRINITY_DN9003_c0_g1_i3:215-844(+)